MVKRNFSQSKGKVKRVWREASEWRRLIARQQESGVSLREFCRRYGISSSAFYRWKKKFSSEADESSLKPSSRKIFTEVSLPSSIAPSVELRRGDISISMHGSVDSALLREAVSALGELPC